MREILTVSSRGQITLPAGMRKHLGIASGGAVIVEECNGELRLKPAAILKMERYTDAQIAEWDRADGLSVDERSSILARLQKVRCACFWTPMFSFGGPQSEWQGRPCHRAGPCRVAAARDKRLRPRRGALKPQAEIP